MKTVTKTGLVHGIAWTRSTAMRVLGLNLNSLTSRRLLVNTDPVDGNPDWAEHHIVDGAPRFAYLSKTAKPETVEVPAIGITGDVIARGATNYRFGALLTHKAADQLGWTTSVRWLRVTDPRGPIGEDLEDRLSATFEKWDPIPRLYVERGYRPSPQPLVWGMTATLILLAVVAAVIATVVSTAELRPFLATFAAVGADHRLARALAAAQAATLGVLGTMAGCAVGALIAMPMALTITGQQQTNPLPPVVAFPWALIIGLVIGIPLVSATVAGLCVPARTVLASRAT